MNVTFFYLLSFSLDFPFYTVQVFSHAEVTSNYVIVNEMPIKSLIYCKVSDKMNLVLTC